MTFASYIFVVSCNCAVLYYISTCALCCTVCSYRIWVPDLRVEDDFELRSSNPTTNQQLDAVSNLGGGGDANIGAEDKLDLLIKEVSNGEIAKVITNSNRVTTRAAAKRAKSVVCVGGQAGAVDRHGSQAKKQENSAGTRHQSHRLV